MARHTASTTGHVRPERFTSEPPLFRLFSVEPEGQDDRGEGEDDEVGFTPEPPLLLSS
jgi:hypothetical protein